MLKYTIHAVAGCYEQGGFFCSGMNNYRLVTENERQTLKASVLTNPPYTHKMTVIKLLKRSFSQLTVLGNGMEMDSTFFKGLAIGSLAMLQ